MLQSQCPWPPDTPTSFLRSAHPEDSRARQTTSGSTRSFSLPLPDAVMSALAMFSLKDPSLLDFEKRRHDENIKNLFRVLNVPSDNKMRTILDSFKTELLRPLFNDVFRQLQLNQSNADLAVNFLQYTEFAADGSIRKRFSWVTDLTITRDNALHLVCGARARWKIENETFNTLKNQGYHAQFWAWRATSVSGLRNADDVGISG